MQRGLRRHRESTTEKKLLKTKEARGSLIVQTKHVAGGIVLAGQNLPLLGGGWGKILICINDSKAITQEREQNNNRIFTWGHFPRASCSYMPVANPNHATEN